MYSSKGDCGITDDELVCGTDQDYSTFSVRTYYTQLSHSHSPFPPLSPKRNDKIKN